MYGGGGSGGGRKKLFKKSFFSLQLFKALKKNFKIFFPFGMLLANGYIFTYEFVLGEKTTTAAVAATNRRRAILLAQLEHTRV